MKNMKYSFEFSWTERHARIILIRWFVYLGANISDVFAYVGTGATPISEMLFNLIWRRDESLAVVFRVIK